MKNLNAQEVTQAPGTDWTSLTPDSQYAYETIFDYMLTFVIILSIGTIAKKIISDD